MKEPAAPRPYGIRPPGFSLPADAHVGAVRLQVSDLSRSIDYYEQVLGFSARAVSPRGAALTTDDGRTLVHLEARPGVTRARRGAFGLYHFAILLPDRPSLGRFVTHLARANVRIAAADHLVSEALYLWDPDGLGIEVYADRPPSTWRHRERQLVMATDPLDLDALAAAGGGEPWRGMPPGTTIGHVHLHVGDLDRAEAFYHRGVGLEKVVWSYPGALFLAAGGYHHHLGTNTWAEGPSPSPEAAQLLEWELVAAGAAADAARSIESAGFQIEEQSSDGCIVRDPWGTRLRIV